MSLFYPLTNHLVLSQNQFAIDSTQNNEVASNYFLRLEQPQDFEDEASPIFAMPYDAQVAHGFQSKDLIEFPVNSDASPRMKPSVLANCS